MKVVNIADINEMDWRGLRDQLADDGWNMQKGGGLDHSWAKLQKGGVEISMEYDRWVEGCVSFPVDARDKVFAALPAAFIQSYAKNLGTR